MKAARGSSHDLGGGYAVSFAAFDDLDASDLYALLKLRFDVFVLEQESLYPELDGEDPRALHAILTFGGGNAPVGTLRILDLEATKGAVKVGRVAIARANRGGGAGRRLLSAAISEIERRAPGRETGLGAQLHLEAFYESFGFARASAIYDDGGIPHVDMIRAPS